MQLSRRWRNRLNEQLAAIGQTQARWESLLDRDLRRPRLKEISDVTDKLRAELLQDIDAADLATCIAVIQRLLPKLDRH